jgi:hypothetical protein
MSDPKVKKKKARERRVVVDILRASGYHTRILNDDLFDVEAIRSKEVREIVIAVGEITKHDEDKLRRVAFPDICTKEVWRKIPGRREFDIRLVM